MALVIALSGFKRTALLLARAATKNVRCEPTVVCNGRVGRTPSLDPLGLNIILRGAVQCSRFLEPSFLGFLETWSGVLRTFGLGVLRTRFMGSKNPGWGSKNVLGGS